MNLLIIVISGLIENLLFIQAPVLGVIPLISAAYLVYLSDKASGLEIMLLSVVAGLLKDSLASSSNLSWGLWIYALIGAIIVVWRGLVLESYSYNFMKLFGVLSVIISVVMVLTEFRLGFNSFEQYFTYLSISALSTFFIVFIFNSLELKS